MSDTRRIVIVTIVCLLVLTGVLLFAWSGDARQAKAVASGPPVKLMVFAGAGMQPPLNELAAVFNKQTGIQVEYSYKGSGCLLPDIAIGRKGDIYIPGELFYMKQAVDRKLIGKYRPVTNMTTVIICQSGNPKKIVKVQDLGRPGLRVGLGDAKAIAIGRAARTVLDKAKCRKAVEKNVVLQCMNVVELANAVKLCQLDAAIVWDGTAALSKGAVTAIPIAPACRVISTVSVGVLNSSQHPKEAARFMDFLASADASAVFAKHGYTPLKPAARGAKAKQI